MMFYADNHCKYEEKLDPHRYVFTGKCKQCKKETSVEVLGQELYKYRQGSLIQDALSNSKEEREFLISGICVECWDLVTKELFPKRSIICYTYLLNMKQIK